MKIAINGDIIDTKDIYKITKIIGNWYFYIQLFKNKDVQVVADLLDEGEDHPGMSENMVALRNIQQLAKLKSIHKQIIKIWSENQSEIPQFNI